MFTVREVATDSATNKVSVGVATDWTSGAAAVVDVSFGSRDADAVVVVVMVARFLVELERSTLSRRRSRTVAASTVCNGVLVVLDLGNVMALVVVIVVGCCCCCCCCRCCTCTS